MKTNLIENRQIRIFISSTFRDMQHERDYLVGKVFPILKKYCRDRDVTLIELDLRWGITEKESKQGKVAEICLRTIENTHPFFVGLLGDRYGWTPSHKEMKEKTKIFDSYPWIDKDLLAGLSITEIEMQYGVLRSEEDIHAYFYFRSPQMDVSEEFKDKPGSIEAQKQECLKSTILQQKKYPVNNYLSVEDLGNQVENDFKALVDRIFPHGELSQLEKERLQQRVFLKSRTNFYIPDADVNECITKFMKSDANALVITGESGMGKSALIANWIVKNENSLDRKLICHFVGNTSAEGDYRKITLRLINEIKALYELDEESVEFEKLGEKSSSRQKLELEKLLLSISNKDKLLIVLDGINQLAEYENAKLLNWLPIFPKNVKVIYSTLLYDDTMDVFRRREYEQLVLQSLTLKRRKQLIIDYLQMYGKKLIPKQVQRIATHKECENTLVLRTLLDELRVFGIHENIVNRIDYYLEATGITDFFDKVLTRFEHTYNNEHADRLVEETLSLIAVSRAGLSEDELLQITGIAPLYWSHFYHAISCHLVTKNGLISFGHQFLGDAVKKKYLQDDSVVKDMRGKIATFFEQQTEKTNRQYDELPHQTYLLGDLVKLHDFLIDIEVFNYIFAKNIYELGLYWRTLIENNKEKYKLSRYLYLGITAQKVKQLGEVIYDRVSSVAHNKYENIQKNNFKKKRIFNKSKINLIKN